MKAKSKTVGASREVQVKSETKNDAAPEPVEVEMIDEIFIEYGLPFIPEGNRIIVNQRAVAAKCAQLHRIKYDETLKAFQRYDEKQGLWVPLHEVGACRLMGDLLLALGEEFGHEEAVFQGKTALLVDGGVKVVEKWRFEIPEKSWHGFRSGRRFNPVSWRCQVAVEGLRRKERRKKGSDEPLEENTKHLAGISNRQNCTTFDLTATC